LLIVSPVVAANATPIRNRQIFDLHRMIYRKPISVKKLWWISGYVAGAETGRVAWCG
jgi:hypothetical protein